MAATVGSLPMEQESLQGVPQHVVYNNQHPHYQDNQDQELRLQEHDTAPASDQSLSSSPSLSPQDDLNQRPNSSSSGSSTSLSSVQRPSQELPPPPSPPPHLILSQQQLQQQQQQFQQF